MPSIVLNQRKLADVTTYAVQSVVTTADPTVLATPLLVTTGPLGESFLRVATLAELVAGTYVYDPLATFQDVAVDVSAVAGPGDTFRVLAPPTFWDDTAPDYVDFEVQSVGSGSLVVVQPFPAYLTGINWELLRSGVVYASGFRGSVVRNDPTQSEFLDSQFTAVFTDSPTALQHLGAVQGMINTLVVAAASDPDTFRNETPGNPVITTYPR